MPSVLLPQYRVFISFLCSGEVFFFFFKLMPPIQSFVPVWNNFFFFDLAQSLAQQSVSHVDGNKVFRLLSQTKSKLCVFMCEAHTHEGTWLHD